MCRKHLDLCSRAVRVGCKDIHEVRAIEMIGNRGYLLFGFLNLELRTTCLRQNVGCLKGNQQVG